MENATLTTVVVEDEWETHHEHLQVEYDSQDALEDMKAKIFKQLHKPNGSEICLETVAVKLTPRNWTSYNNPKTIWKAKVICPKKQANLDSVLTSLKELPNVHSSPELFKQMSGTKVAIVKQEFFVQTVVITYGKPNAAVNILLDRVPGVFKFSNEKWHWPEGRPVEGGYQFQKGTVSFDTGCAFRHNLSDVLTFCVVQEKVIDGIVQTSQRLATNQSVYRTRYFGSAEEAKELAFCEAADHGLGVAGSFAILAEKIDVDGLCFLENNKWYVM
ncbi:MAG: hypothetical protein M1822_008843 [Bathelium mastoideum]|nr:MAG: hypothetical protein M1822_008843 [Bathelium mastoideum]